MSKELIGNLNDCLDAKSAYDNILGRYNLLIKYFNERYEIGAFYFMDYEHKKYIRDRFLNVLNSTGRIIYQCVPRPGMNEYRNYDFYLGHVDSENLWHGSGVYSWEWEKDDDGDTIIIYFVGEFCHGELTSNGVWCIFSSDDGKLRLEIDGVISVGALGDPSRYCYYAGRRDIRRSPQHLKKIKEEQARQEQQRRIAEQKRLEEERIRQEEREKERLRRDKLMKERARKEEERQIKEAEERAKHQAEQREIRKYSNDHYWALKLRSSIAPVAMILVTYLMFVSPVSIVEKWAVMPWWGCALYILGILVGILVTIVLGALAAGGDKYVFESAVTSVTYSIITWMGYLSIQASVNGNKAWFTILCVVVFLLILLHLSIPDMNDYDDIICFADSNGSPDKAKTTIASLGFLILIVGLSLLAFMLLR